MLTLAAIKENPEEIIRKLAKKHFDGREVIAKVLDLDKVRRSSQMELDSRLSELKGLSAQVGKLMKEGKSDEAEAVKMKVAEMKEANKKLEEDMAGLPQRPGLPRYFFLYLIRRAIWFPRVARPKIMSWSVRVA